MTFGAPQTILVEFSDHVVLIEGPTNDARSMATIAEARRMLPNKPIKYLVNTHHHSDHAGGIRAYVAEGIPIIAHEAQRRYYEQQIFRNPHSLNPDRLARAPKALRLETVRDRRVLTDGTRTLELHHMRGNFHSDGLLMAYLPAEKILIQADAFAPRPGVPPLPAPSPYTVNLVENIERLKLDVERVVHVHGGSDPIATVRAAAGRAPTE
jgi:glyoxylase-like metal-dependent hydrolase (beta-lactamase superfamily II)